jgi:hypothetical protein
LRARFPSRTALFDDLHGNLSENPGFSLLPNRTWLGTLEGVNPPLDAPSFLPEPRLPAPAVRSVAPNVVHDLRGCPVDELTYPATAALVMAGVPGAGKSTALHALFGSSADAEEPPSGPEGSVVLDSHHSRNWWRHRLGWLPYPFWRPIVHIAHFSRVRTALRDGAGPVVIHDCATFGWARRMIARWAAKYGRELHVILLDVPETVARAGQYARGRRINSFFFTLHCQRWQRLIRDIVAGHPPRPMPASIVIVDRANINRLQRVGFAA